MCGSIFGGKARVPEIQKVDPAVTNVTSGDMNADTTSDAEAARKKRLRQCYSSTTMATQTQGKNTLG